MGIIPDVAESDRVPAVVGRRGDQVHLRPQTAALDKGQVSPGQRVIKVMGRRQCLVPGAAVVVRAIAQPLAVVKGTAHLVGHRFQPLDGIFFCVIPVRGIKAEREESVMVLPGLSGRHQVLIQIRPVLYIHCISIEDLVDYLAVFQLEERVVVDELPDVEEIPEDKIDIRPGLGDPFAARLGAAVEDRHPVSVELRPFLVAREEIHEAPLGDCPVRRPLPEVFDRRPQGGLDARGNGRERVRGLEQPHGADRLGAGGERVQESLQRGAQAAIVAGADDHDVFRSVPHGFRGVNVISALSREVGVRVGQAFHVHLEDPRVVRDVTGEDQVLAPEVLRLDGVRGFPGNGDAGLSP